MAFLVVWAERCLASSGAPVAPGDTLGIDLLVTVPLMVAGARVELGCSTAEVKAVGLDASNDSRLPEEDATPDDCRLVGEAGVSDDCRLLGEESIPDDSRLLGEDGIAADSDGTS